MGRKSEYGRIIMVNIRTGQRLEADCLSEAAKIFHISTGQIRRYIETGKANREGWTFDDEGVKDVC